ncbi:protease modulator HflC [Ketobacter sp. MCCC 1A13808]|uniref:protease modulator HflC n=1 Tax=Ketobacter sp. MCCC 1A13808 TaxID=2602738 RepID=UPI000F1AAEA6|nr:protease modulator HflC [Ketobacter sp. MCCC 1A13808]MVF11610.1 protease modulator HflC [Ketobacter sp. MCCC 1A13808]RLP55221.1 MAG: protease modulator HflC [Ketobacter sp.]
MNNKSMTLLLVLALIALLVSGTLFTVKESERGVLLKFGEVVREDLKPGLHFKMPLIHEPRVFDGRIRVMEMRQEEYLTQEKKRLIVDSYVMWRIQDVKQFFIATGGGLEQRVNLLLGPRVNEGLRNQFGERTVYEVVAGEREELVVDLTESIDKKAKENLGIDVVEIRVKRIELPAAVSGSVYDRMRAEREREARSHRARGNELAEGIKAAADRERTEIIAGAYRQAEELRGAGDAEAATIYAKAYNKDPDFFAFSRSMDAYRGVFSSKDDLILVSPEGEFFEYMKKE